jgi:outer membrane protein assembly factor BamB
VRSFWLLLLVCVSTGPSGAQETGEARGGWPSLAGPLGTFESLPAETPLVEDLSQAKKLWESEFADLGRAKGTSQVFRRVDQFTAEAIAKHGSHPGSWAGPVVADGVVFCASWRPRGDWVDIQGHKVRLDAEDFVVAIDAWTGKTRWLAVEPGGILKGGGKRQGYQVAPVVHRGVVYSLGSTARLFAYEAAGGKKLWESEAHPAREVEKQAREAALAGLAAGKFSYQLTPNWCASLAVVGDVIVAPAPPDGLVAVDIATGRKRWTLSGVNSRWATPAVWRHDGREYLLVGNEKGELRLIDPAAGKELWKLGGLGPTWFTLAPGRTHVLVNVEAGSGKPRDEEPKPGRLGAVRLSPASGEKAWVVGDGKNHGIPVWMDSGARIRVLYRNGRFLVPNAGQKTGEEAGPRRIVWPALLIEESDGKTVAEMGGADSVNEQLAGLIYWCGDRILSRADSYHGPSHGGRHPWIHWSVAGGKITRLPGKMDLSEFTSAYEVSMEAPLVGGLMFERTMKGTVVCYDLRLRAKE